MILLHLILLLDGHVLRGDERGDLYIPRRLLEGEKAGELIDVDAGVEAALTFWLGQILFIGYPAWIAVDIVEGA
jgi:hypothetical protein